MSTWIPLAAAIGAALIATGFAVDSMRCARRSSLIDLQQEAGNQQGGDTS